MTITEFLLARIAEDEAVARAIYDHDRWILEEDGNGDEWVTEVDRADQHWRVAMTKRIGHGEHIARHDPARVLAECEAKRRIVDGLEAAFVANSNGTFAREKLLGMLDAVGFIAAVYADHPDFDEAWRAE